MLAYGIIQLSSKVISAMALCAIAVSLYSLNQESTLFNKCVEEIQTSGKNTSNAVRYCNGGKW